MAMKFANPLGGGGSGFDSVAGWVLPTPTKASSGGGLLKWFRKAPAKAAPRSTTAVSVPPYGGMGNPTLTSADDVARLAAQNAPPVAPPIKGRTQFLADPKTRAFVVKTGTVLGAAALTPPIIDRFTKTFNSEDYKEANPAKPLENTAKSATDAATYAFSETFKTMFDGFRGLFGTVGEGAKSLALPLILLGGGFLVFNALNAKAKRR